MSDYPRAAVERAMKVQTVMLRAMAKSITWWEWPNWSKVKVADY